MSFYDQLTHHVGDDLKQDIPYLRYDHTEYQHDGVRGEIMEDVYFVPRTCQYLRVVQVDGVVTRTELMDFDEKAARFLDAVRDRVKRFFQRRAAEKSTSTPPITTTSDALCCGRRGDDDATTAA